MELNNYFLQFVADLCTMVVTSHVLLTFFRLKGIIQ